MKITPKLKMKLDEGVTITNAAGFSFYRTKSGQWYKDGSHEGEVVKTDVNYVPMWVLEEYDESIKSQTKETMMLINLKKGDYFTQGGGTYRIIGLAPRPKCIRIDKREGYKYFTQYCIVKKIKKPGCLLPMADIRVGDRIAPFSWPDDLMTVTAVDKNEISVVLDDHVSGYAPDKHRHTTLRDFQRLWAYNRQQVRLSGLYAGDEYATTKTTGGATTHPYFKGDDACISNGKVLIRGKVGALAGITYTNTIKSMGSDLHTLNLMSEEEFKAKYEKLKLYHWEVTDEGDNIRVACPVHKGEVFAKSDIHSFMSVVQRILKEKDRFGASIKGVYEFLLKNEKKLEL